MDDDGVDDEIHSPVSPSSPYNGRISVAVTAATAAAPPPVSPPQREPSPSAAYHVLALAAVPKTNGGGGREDCWSESATAVLIDAWAERYVELSRGILKQHHWKEVADIVRSREDYIKPPKTDIQCKNRIDTVKKKFKSEKAKIDAGGGPSLWPFYHRIEQLIGMNPSTTASVRVPTGIPVGKRSGSQRRQQQQPYQFANLMNNGRQKEDEEEEEEEDEEEEDKKRRMTMQQNGGKEEEKKKEEDRWGDSIRMLTASIVKLGEAYEQTEKKKLDQVVEMEKTRMKFMQEMELQRMQFFMKTQMEISQLKRTARRMRRQSPSPPPPPPPPPAGGGIGIVAAAAAAASDGKPMRSIDSSSDSEDELKEDELSE
ncbi:Trihelix transcription factor ASIL2 [Linum grandiflorum]